MPNNNPTDAAKYLIENPDVARAGMGAWEHYTLYGRAEGRQWGTPDVKPAPPPPTPPTPAPTFTPTPVPVYSANPDRIDGRAFLKCDGTDEVAGLRALLVAGANKETILPAGIVKFSSTPDTPAITLDPNQNYRVIGYGACGSYTPNTATLLENIGTGQVFNCTATTGTDFFLHLEHFQIRLINTANLAHTIFLRYICRFKSNGLGIQGSGAAGIRLERCFSSRIKNTDIAFCRGWGVDYWEEANNISIEDCGIMVNGSDTGHGNIRISGTPGHENYGVNISSTDFSYAGSSEWTGRPLPVETYGLLMEHTMGARLHVYVEQNPTPAITNYRAGYIAKSKGVDMVGGGLIMDGIWEFASDCTECQVSGPNVFLNMSRASGIKANMPAGANFRYVNQVLRGNSTQSFTGAGATML